jgi:dTDP-4-dehydrorhamnose reductase
MIRLIVTGRQGQLATSLASAAHAHPAVQVVCLGRPDFDLENPDTIASSIASARPDIVVNAAAYTQVDKAEQEEELAFKVNRDGAGAAAAAARALGVPVIHLSTDYVFPGDKPGPYVESDAVGPLGAYGRSKLAGEQAVHAAHPKALILRTSWVYSPYGANFVKTMLRIGATREVVNVVDDQLGNPTSAPDLASAILRIAPQLVATGGEAGTYHLSGEGFVTWCGFAREIFAASAALGGPHPEVKAITTADYPTPAKRPANSRLSTAAFQARFGFALPPWQDATNRTIRQLLAGPP